MNKNGKLVFNSYIARQLLVKYGHKIIDLKKDHNRLESTIFVFEYTNKIDEDIAEIAKENKLK